MTFDAFMNVDGIESEYLDDDTKVGSNSLPTTNTQFRD